jgi:hypothetical protein
VVKETPVKGQEHSLDGTRYVSMYLDATDGAIPLAASGDSQPERIFTGELPQEDAALLERQSLIALLSGLGRTA